MSKTTRVALFLVFGALVLIFVRVGIGLANQPSDQAQIQTALKNSLEAGREGKPGSVISMLSDQLKVNNQTAPDLSQIAQFIRENKPDVTVERTQALITGDEARIVSPVDVKVNFVGQTLQQRLEGVTLVFRKEPARQFLVLPTSAWRLTEVRLPENGLSIAQ